MTVASLQRPIRTLLFSTLFPSAARPTHGVFVETRLRELLKLGGIETRVVAPVPWFPSTSPRFGSWARMAATPAFEERGGVPVWHPRYLLPPSVGMNIAPLVLALGARSTVARLLREGFDFDVIDAHYFYPDGVAAALLARWFNKPFTVTARGTDISLIPQYPLPRKMIRWAAAQASASIGVCAALADALLALGVAPERVQVMRNGVDLDRFSPLDREACRRELGLPITGPVLLAVGHLIEVKGQHLAIEALQALPDAHLVMVGDGPQREALRQQAADLGVSARVTFAGSRPNTELASWYSAADLLILASSREGWANVLLESMACGTPVVATRVWGTPEVVQQDAAGVLIDERSAAGVTAGVKQLLAAMPRRAEVRAYAEGFGWAPTSQAQLALFRQIAGQA